MKESIIVRTVTLFAVGLVACVSDGQTPVNEPIKSVRISGRVTDVTGRPIANAPVKIKVPGPAQNTTITQTDEKGSVTFPAVVPQQFELFLEVPGFSLLTVPVKAARGSASIDVGTVVIEVAPIENPVTAPYDPSTLPNWLKSDPGATFLPNPPADREENTASRWQTASCSELNRSARRIVSMNRIVEFHIPPSAHLTETADADYVDYHVRYGPSREKAWLKFTVGPMVGDTRPMMLRKGLLDGRGENGPAMASKAMTYAAVLLMAVGGVTSTSRQADSLLTKASPLRLRTTLMESWTLCVAQRRHFDGSSA